MGRTNKESPNGAHQRAAAVVASGIGVSPQDITNPSGRIDRWTRQALGSQNPGNLNRGPNEERSALVPSELQTTIYGTNGEILFHGQMPTETPSEPSSTPIRDDRFEPHFWMLNPNNKAAFERSQFIGQYIDPHAALEIALRTNKAWYSKHRERKRRHNLGNNPTPEEIIAFDAKEAEFEARARERLNMKAIKGVMRRFNIADPEEAMDFIEEQFVNAQRAVQYAKELIDPDSGALNSRNEIEFAPHDIGEIVAEYADPESDPTMIYEYTRLPVYADLAAQQVSLERRTKPRRKLARIQRLLNREFYEGGAGAAEDMKIRALFDNETLEVKFVEGLKGPTPNTVIRIEKTPPGMHRKEFDIAWRTVQGFGYKVRTDPDVKGIDSAIIKALKKAALRAAEFEKDEDKRRVDTLTMDDVADTHRMIFAVFGDMVDAHIVMERVREILLDPKNQIRLADRDLGGRVQYEDGLPVGRVTKITEDHSTNGSPDQSDEVFFWRLQVFFDGVKDPVELKFQDIIGYLNDMWYLGTFDKDDGQYTGPEHNNYNVNKVVQAKDGIFPFEIYRRAIGSLAARTMHRLKKSKRGERGTLGKYK